MRVSTEVRNAARSLTKNLLEKGYKPTALYSWGDPTRQIEFWKVRLDHPTLGKWIRPLSRDGDRYVLREPVITGPKPLYNLEALLREDTAQVWVVEGEKCADALGRFELLTTTSGGSNSASHADWSVLRGRSIIIWADNDASGIKYREDVTEILRTLRCSVAWIDFDALGLEEKEDCVNYLARYPATERRDLAGLPTIIKIENHPTSAKLKPEQWPEPVPFEKKEEKYPLASLPEMVRNAVSEYAEYGQQPIPLIACSALTALSLAGQGVANVARDSNLIGPISLYLLVVAESGSRKSAADSVFSQPLRDWEQEKRISMSEEIKRSKAEHSAWRSEYEGLQSQIKATARAAAKSHLKKDDLRRFKEKLIEHELNEPKILAECHIFHEVTTFQALTFAIANGWPSTAFLSDEAGLVIGSHALGRDTGMQMFSLLNRLWDGKEFVNRTKNAGTDYIQGVRMSSGLMMQGVVLSELLSMGSGISRGGGFLARNLICKPVSTMGTRYYKEPPVNLNHVASYQQRILELVSTSLALDERGRLDPVLLTLSSAAKEVWKSYHDEVESDLGVEGIYSEITDFGSKSAENAVRLAALFHILENGVSGEVSQSNMCRGVSVARWYLKEALRVLGCHRLSEELNLAQLLLNWLIGHGEKIVSKNDIQNRGPNKVRRSSKCEMALNALERRHYIRTEKLNRNRVQVLLNPCLLKTG